MVSVGAMAFVERLEGEALLGIGVWTPAWNFPVCVYYGGFVVAEGSCEL
jgi:hypothetical protein